MAEERVVSSQKGELEVLREEGLLLVEGGKVRLTREGKAVSDRIAEMLIPDA
jgi:oxygen-independent coproporphyrinogen-3 oxidase